MSEIKKHLCPSCGGNLSVDIDKQMYRCTSCGSTYDYDYFREDKMHEMGETNLSRGEFMAAIDAYKLVLEKEPDDFRALRGVMLASARLKNIDELTTVGEAKNFTYNSRLADEAIENASEQDKEYFTKFGKIYEDKVRFVDCNREIKSLKSERDRIDKTSQLVDDSRIDYYFTGRYGTRYSPKAWLFMTIGVTAIFVAIPLLALIAIGFDNAFGTMSVLSVIDAILILASAVYSIVRIYPRMKKIKIIDGEIVGYTIESGKIGTKIKELEEEAKKLDSEIKRSIDNFIKNDRLIMSEPIKEQAAETVAIKKQISETGAVKKHQCPSCGGRLRVDNDKQMYLCTFCGSTYDYEYFREDRIHEAGETYLSRGEFMASSDAYGFMLKKDPHDFQALRGLMLAAAHMTSVDELEQDDDPGEFSYDPDKVERAIENALEEDKEYFRELAKVYSEKKVLADHTKELEALWEEKKKFNDVIAQNNVSRHMYYSNGKHGSKEHPISTLVIYIAVSIYITVITAGFGIAFYGALEAGSDSAGTFRILFIIFSVILLGIMVYGFIDIIPKIFKLKKLDKANSELYAEAGRIDRKINDLEEESAKLIAGIRRSIHVFVKKDRAVMRDKGIE